MECLEISVSYLIHASMGYVGSRPYREWKKRNDKR